MKFLVWEFMFTTDTKIINNGNTLRVAFTGIRTGVTDTVDLHCDGDEKQILSFDITFDTAKESSKLIINIQCKSHTTENVVTLNITDIWKGSINPTKPVQQVQPVPRVVCGTDPSPPQYGCGTEPQPSIMSYHPRCGTCSRDRK